MSRAAKRETGFPPPPICVSHANGFAFSNAVLPETRVRVPGFEKQASIGASTWLTSTSRWGCGYRYDGTAAGRLVGLDYADQRFYASTYGRFNTPDPYSGSANLGNPGSWNRYSYTLGDPINGNDPTGLCDVVIAGVTQSSATAPDVQDFADSNAAISVYPFSADAGSSKIFGAFSGVVQTAAQAFGANSSTYAAVAGLALAAQDGNPINVTAYSGGAGTLTAAVNFLNNNGGSDITSLINNITYVAPGSAGDLYNNGHVAWIGGGLANGIVAGATSIPQTPAPPQFFIDKNNCGHNFGCLVNEFTTDLAKRKGDDCSTPTIINQQNNSSWQRMFMKNYGDPFWYWTDPPAPREQEN